MKKCLTKTIFVSIITLIFLLVGEGVALADVWRTEKRSLVDGHLIWSQNSITTGGPTGVAIDNTGIYIIGLDFSSTPKVRIEKRSLSDGNLIWTYLKDVTYFTGSMGFTRIAVDNSGIYISWVDQSTFPGEVWVTDKISLTDRSSIWSKTYSAPFISAVPHDLTIDNSGVYSTGIHFLGSGNFVWRTEKRSLVDGFLIWNTSGFYGDPYAIKVDGPAVYIAGSIGSSPVQGRIEKRSSSDGILLWEISIPGGITEIDLESDTSGIYVIPHSGYATKIEKRSLNDGSLIWTFDRPAIMNQPINNFRLKIDNSGVYSSGVDFKSIVGSPSPRWSVSKLNLGGVLLWSTIVNDMVIGWTSDMARDDSGVYIVGTHVPMPDLTSNLPNATPLTAGNITFSGLVKNIGSQDISTTFDNHIQIDINNNSIYGEVGDVDLLTSPSLSNVPAGGSALVSTIPYNMSIGNYKARLCVDHLPLETTITVTTCDASGCYDEDVTTPAGSISDSNEENNCSGDFSFTVTSTIDICPNVTGAQAFGPCADTVCTSSGGTWNVVTQICEMPCPSGHISNCILPSTPSGNIGNGTCSVGSTVCTYTCTNGSWGTPATNSCTPPVIANITTFKTTPRVVEKGSPGTLVWTLTGINEAGCSLTGGLLGTSQTPVTGNDGLGNPSAGSLSVTVEAMTTYTFTCGSVSKTATFEVVPVGFES